MKCIDCPFANTTDHFTNDRIKYCPIDGKVYDLNHECHIGLHGLYTSVSYDECPNMKYKGGE